MNLKKSVLKILCVTILMAELNLKFSILIKLYWMKNHMKIFFLYDASYKTFAY